MNFQISTNIPKKLLSGIEDQLSAWQFALELTFIGLSALLILTYHTIYFIIFILRPLLTKLGANIYLREKWIEKLFQKYDVIAIQVIRNHIMVCTLYASGILTVIGFLVPQFLKGALITIRNLDFTGSVLNITVIRIKLLIIFCILLFAFFAFTQSMKMGVHLGFLMNLAAGDPVMTRMNIDMPEAKRLARDMSFYFWVGMRGFYFAFLFLLYLVGPSWLLGSTILLILILFFLIDYTRLNFFDCFMICRRGKKKVLEDVALKDPTTYGSDDTKDRKKSEDRSEDEDDTHSYHQRNHVD